MRRGLGVKLELMAAMLTDGAAMVNEVPAFRTMLPLPATEAVFLFAVRFDATVKRPIGFFLLLPFHQNASQIPSHSNQVRDNQDDIEDVKLVNHSVKPFPLFC